MKKRVIKRGQSILEVVIATTLISMGVIAALSLTNQSQKSSNYAKTLDAATAYNNQLADYLRNQKSLLGYATLEELFVGHSAGGVVTYCIDTIPADSTAFLALTPGICGDTDLIAGTTFKRQMEVDVTGSGSGSITATITTSWTDNTVRSAVLNMELSKWK